MIVVQVTSSEELRATIRKALDDKHIAIWTGGQAVFIFDAPERACVALKQLAAARASLLKEEITTIMAFTDDDDKVGIGFGLETPQCAAMYGVTEEQFHAHCEGDPGMVRPN